jgi:hypothetical protein
MPPQQGYRLPDLVDNVLRFRAHGFSFGPVLFGLFGIGAIHRHGIAACKAKWAGSTVIPKSGIRFPEKVRRQPI